ncbi:BEN domain-containing protein 2 [Ictalurus punctatus]|uniref:BEN domain-containing protein 2 n=1 Tax=Ictalurus punctatus TaxID=7998 RepID=A0A2D0SHK3_ICTPU|nr:BEN domain-containing protein 2 [Ictalurus punctatus]
MSSHDAWETKLEIRACSFDSSPAGGDKHRDCSSPNDSTGKSETCAEIFGTDPLRTLGEILTYCQVMYEAIQKLDEKFELLQARVTHTQEDQIHVEEDQSEIYTLDDQINDESAETYHVLHHLVPPSVPPSPEGSRTLRLVVTSEKPTDPSPSPQNQPQQSGSTSRPRGAVRKMLLEQRKVPEDHPDTNTGHSASPQTVKEVLHRRRKNPNPQTHNATVGSRKFVIPSSVLMMASAMARPTAAARYLMRSLFSRQELLHGSIRGYTSRGLKKLNPEKINAIREWAQMTYPEHDLREKGKDWKACLAVMNEGARHVRLKDRKRKFKAVRDASEQAASVQEFNPEPTAEIDVELSDGDGEDLQQTTTLKNKLKRESGEEPLSENDCSYEPGAQVYLGVPDRDVKVPQFAMYSALQRPNPPLVARYLIRFIFPEEVLVQSNVYGNAKYGIQPLDHNKISALREYLCERFPYMKLDEDGPNWKACVYAINGAIRKTRHALKKGPKQAREVMLVTS